MPECDTNELKKTSASPLLSFSSSIFIMSFCITSLFYHHIVLAIVLFTSLANLNQEGLVKMIEYIMLFIVFVVLFFCYVIYIELKRQKDEILKVQAELTVQKEPVAGLEAVSSVLQSSAKDIREATQTVDKEVAKLLEQAKWQKEIRDEVKAMREIIIGTTTRGIAGEKLLQRTLSTLPPTMIESNLNLSAGIVEYGLKFPDGKYLPIDSKFPYPKDIDMLSEVNDEQKSRIIKDIAANFKNRVKEVSKYVNDERTISFAIAAFPDSIFSLLNDNYPQVISEAFKKNVIATSYSNIQQILLAILQIREFYGVEVDIERTLTNIEIIKNLTGEIDKIIENKLDRSNTMMVNAVRELRSNIDKIKVSLEDIRVDKEEKV